MYLTLPSRTYRLALQGHHILRAAPFLFNTYTIPKTTRTRSNESEFCHAHITLNLFFPQFCRRARVKQSNTVKTNRTIIRAAWFNLLPGVRLRSIYQVFSLGS